uniref:UDP-N-acetylmuramoyl-tripeptide--D-alanyl-D-alanine ligase n=1 Tax=Ammonifex degensii TaxID=42838 RepID=A0A7C2IWI2_9THEO
MLSLTIGEITKVLGASLLQGDPARRVTAVTTDSRKVVSGTLFFALKGERYDGHSFVGEAVAGGAAGAVVSRPVPVPPEAVLLVVPDVLTALGDLARHVRQQAGVFVLGVTGSTGKTTVKDMIAAVLGVRYRVLATRGNLNNEVGLPLTLLELGLEHQVAVVEMAMRRPGEITALARVASPNAAVITNVGETHLERLGSVRAIAAAKGEILDFVPPEGFAVLHAESPFILEEAKRCRGRLIFFGTGDKATVRLVGYRPAGGAVSFRVVAGGREEEYSLPVPGQHNAVNALAAVAVAREMGLGPGEIREGLQRVRLSGMRLEIKDCGPLTVINDAYNANPASMRAALAVLEEVAQGRRRVAVLGDMLELGERAAEAHREVGEAAVNRADLIVTVGKLAEGIAAGAGFASGRVVSCPDAAAAVAVLRKILRGNEVVLVKASRGMHLETVVDALCAGGERG